MEKEDCRAKSKLSEIRGGSAFLNWQFQLYNPLSIAVPLIATKSLMSKV